MDLKSFLKNKSQTFVWLLFDRGHPNPYIFNMKCVILFDANIQNKRHTCQQKSKLINKF